jgi:MoaA/NifB/PqqE/SkfB family radical SAM enzyme
MKENVGEVPDLVKLAKELRVGISLALVYNYEDISIEQLSSREISKVANTLVEMKRQGYPIVHSVDYLRIMGGEQSWDCKPWLVANVDPLGRVTQPCYCLSNYKSSMKVSDVDIGSLWRKYDWSRYKGCSKCTLHCYVEPSLIQSFNVGTYRNWGRIIKKI